MTIDNEQKLWLATPKGISIFEPGTNKFTNLKAEDNSKTLSDITNIYCDNEGMVWICSADEKGFSVYNKFKWSFSNYNNIPGDNNNLTNNSVNSICEDSLGNFWIGTDNGIDILNKGKEKIRHLEHNPKDTTSLSNNRIQNIYKDKKNFMWMIRW